MLVSSPDRTTGALNAADAPVPQRRVRASLFVRLIRSVGRDPFAHIAPAVSSRSAKQPKKKQCAQF